LEIKFDRVYHILNLAILILGQDWHIFIREVNDILEISSTPIDTE
jgi:hypothetical protein